MFNQGNKHSKNNCKRINVLRCPKDRPTRRERLDCL